ncbi:WD40/YVTN/BNR-like repeat-containing protein [Taibaiella soli]|uniref:Photosynthesis system II assembly factor Ycf48/Hcf136-like domain-containing protein n=1 Tax=Taibaiella soli TaxID=1649169 RepID=A0A2W2BDP9_9BACT|nr:YCF48-related protein [Taibaiella soli]PZF74007.1 hypothetical protein DN068_05280 [Taibaiella soli]
MKRSLLLIIFLYAASMANAQWTHLDTGYPTLNISKLAFPAPAIGYALCDFNLLQTTDSGKHWKVNRTFPYNSYVRLTMQFITPARGWIGGGQFPDGFICRTVDSGKTWTTFSTPLRQIYALDFIDSLNGWAVGNDNDSHPVYHTTDGGITWKEQALLDDVQRSIYFVSDSVGWSVGDNGTLWATRNAGANWERQTCKDVFHFSSVYAISDSVAWAAGGYLYGGCYFTKNGGHTWTEQELPSLAHLKQITFTSRTTGWAVGDRGTLLFTDNAGKNWIQLPTGTRADLSGIAFPTPDKIIIGGKEGLIETKSLNR